jgi:uncharacterized protein YoxC
MTVQVDIFVLIILLVAIVLAVFLLQMIWQMKKTAQKTDLFIHDLRTELIPSLRDFREIMERLNRASVKIEKGSGNAENLFKSLDEVVASVRHLSYFFRLDNWHLAENAATLILGIKAASRVFSQKNS